MSFTPIPNPLPVSGPLTDAELRASPVDTHFLEPGTGFHARMTPLGDVRQVTPFRLVGSGFDASLDTRFWSSATSGAGATVTVANGIATVTSGTAAGYAQIQTVRKARFIFAHPHQFRAAVRFPDTTEANCTRYIGAFNTSPAGTISDGFAFVVNSLGELRLSCYYAGAPNYTVASGNFNGDVTSYTLDTNVHAFEIQYFVMGAWFYIDGVLIHHFSPTATPFCTTYTTNATALSSNSGTEPGVIEVWAMNIVRLGRDTTSPMSYYHAAATTAGVTLKVGAGNIHHAIVSQIANNANVTLYDNTAASGTVIWTSGAMPANATPYTLEFDDIPFTTGLTFAVTGAACSLVWIYE